MEQIVTSTLDRCPRAGRWTYRDFPDADPVPVEIHFFEGECVVRFLPIGEDQGAEVLLRDMAAWPNWREHFTRAG